MRVTPLGIALVATGCAASVDSPEVPEDVFEVEPGLFVSLDPSDGKYDLPNAQFSARPLDTSGYRAIADRFISLGFAKKFPAQLVISL